MATKTLGTNATNSLTAMLMARGGMPAADVATISQGVKDDLTNTNPIWPGAWSTPGLLFIPHRGVLKVLPGDYVAIDSLGWPLLVSANSIANGAWTHS